jgi:MFS transporter, DHA2 family, methylenomycin A resistance protein
MEYHNKTYSSKWILALIGLSLGCIVLPMAYSGINTALAAIRLGLDSSVTQIQWMMNIYGIVGASTLVTMGKFADIFGRKKLFIIGLVILFISMLGSGLSNNIGWVIFFQALFGLACGIILPVSQVLFSQLYPEEQKNRALGLWAAIGGVGFAIGPLFGGCFNVVCYCAYGNIVAGIRKAI